MKNNNMQTVILYGFYDKIIFKTSKINIILENF